MLQCQLSREQHRSIEALLETIRIFLGSRKKSFILRVVDDPFIETIAEIGLISIGPVTPVLFSKNPETYVTESSREHLSG